MRTIRVDDEVYELVTRYARLWNQTHGQTAALIRLHEQPEHTAAAPPSTTTIEANGTGSGEASR